MVEQIAFDFIEIEETFCGSMDGWMHRRTFLTSFNSSTLSSSTRSKSRPKNGSHPSHGWLVGVG